MNKVRLKEGAGFKLGDEVEVVSSTAFPEKVGLIGRIKYIGKSAGHHFNFLYAVKSENGSAGVDETEIRHVRIYDNALNRKLYPKRVPEGGYLVRPRES